MNNTVIINGVSCPVDVYRNKHRADTAYHVVAGHTILGQVVKKSTNQWEAHIFKDEVETTSHKRRHIAVDHLIKEWEAR